MLISELRMRAVPTYWANIYVAYSAEWSYGMTDPYADAIEQCRNYVDKIGLCVTVSKTEFLYTDGREDGIVVGLINYPRFPVKPAVIRKRAIALAEILKKQLKQKRVSIEFPDETILLGTVK